jgi:hypothetical protein
MSNTCSRVYGILPHIIDYENSGALDTHTKASFLLIVSLDLMVVWYVDFDQDMTFMLLED